MIDCFMKMPVFSISKHFCTFFACLLFASLFLSCKKKEEIPADILPKNKMTAILTDIHLNEAMINEQRYKRDSLPEISSTFYCNIFEKHETTADEFQKSLDYYSFHLDELKKVYQEVVAELNKDM